MAIYGVGAKYEHDDVSEDFIANNFVATGWHVNDAPDLHEYFKAIEAGDVVYIKSCSYSSNITVKAIGIVIDESILTDHDHNLIEIGRNVKWIYTRQFWMEKPQSQKNNVRANTLYREFHPEIIETIMHYVNTHL